MQPPNLSDYPVLRIYEAAEAWAGETSKPVIICLHQIAAAIAAGSLNIEINATWRLISHYEQRVRYSDSPAARWGLSSYPEKYVSSRWKEPIYKPWTVEDSPCIAELKKPPMSLLEPRGLKAALYQEGITIDREDFRLWLNATGQSLPKFWFRDETTFEPFEPSPPPAPAPPDLPLSNDQIIAHRRTAALHWLTENPEADITAAADHLRGLDVTGVELFRVFVSVKRMKDPGRLLEQYDANNSKDKFKERKRLGNLICKKLPKAKK